MVHADFDKSLRENGRGLMMKRMTDCTFGLVCGPHASRESIILRIDSFYSFLNYKLPFGLIDFQIAQQNSL
jgi:hypothetical protein